VKVTITLTQSEVRALLDAAGRGIDEHQFERDDVEHGDGTSRFSKHDLEQQNYAFGLVLDALRKAGGSW
jgi:hypothetical protein